MDRLLPGAGFRPHLSQVSFFHFLFCRTPLGGRRCAPPPTPALSIFVSFYPSSTFLFGSVYLSFFWVYMLKVTKLLFLANIVSKIHKDVSKPQQPCNNNQSQPETWQSAANTSKSPTQSGQIAVNTSKSQPQSSKSAAKINKFQRSSYPSVANSSKSQH